LKTVIRGWAKKLNLFFKTFFNFFSKKLFSKKENFFVRFEEEITCTI
jgi:hypothetical protein